MVIDQQNTLNDFDKPNAAFSKLDSELSVAKQVSSLLLSRLVNMERQCLANAQYSRQRSLDKIDIPNEVKADVLEKKLKYIFKKLGDSISPNHIETCHGVTK